MRCWRSMTARRLRRPAICSRWRSWFHALPPVKPDDRFVRALYDELSTVNAPSLTLVERIRHMPRIRLAAAGIGGAATLTVTAGVVWIAWRSEGGLMGLLRRWMPAA